MSEEFTPLVGRAATGDPYLDIVRGLHAATARIMVGGIPSFTPAQEARIREIVRDELHSREVLLERDERGFIVGVEVRPRSPSQGLQRNSEPPSEIDPHGPR